jgi:triphosphoribosyl-dephospho-CoA synthase
MALATKDTIAVSSQLACLLEVSAEKPGNVTPTHSFDDMYYEDFLRSAVAIGPEMARAGERGVGETILASIVATRHWTKTNTNLGIVLLFVPLARAALCYQGKLRPGLKEILRQLTLADAEAAYTAIRMAEPGGFDESVEHDVRHQPTVTLREAMASAVHRDNVAAEYLSDYAITFERGLPSLESSLGRGAPLSQAVVQTYLEILAAVPDTLIGRKHGQGVSQAVSEDAAQVLSLGGTFSQQGCRAVTEFDERLRKEKGGLNPGTTADLVATTLFVALLEEIIK